MKLRDAGEPTDPGQTELFFPEYIVRRNVTNEEMAIWKIDLLNRLENHVDEPVIKVRGRFNDHDPSNALNGEFTAKIGELKSFDSTSRKLIIGPQATIGRTVPADTEREPAKIQTYSQFVNFEDLRAFNSVKIGPTDAETVPEFQVIAGEAEIQEWLETQGKLLGFEPYMLLEAANLLKLNITRTPEMIESGSIRIEQLIEEIKASYRESAFIGETRELAFRNMGKDAIAFAGGMALMKVPANETEFKYKTIESRTAQNNTDLRRKQLLCELTALGLTPDAFSYMMLQSLGLTLPEFSPSDNPTAEEIIAETEAKKLAEILQSQSGTKWQRGLGDFRNPLPQRGGTSK